ncbi:peptide transport system permease protein sapB [Raoultella ornithinolytica]|nr:peptide transport system permease protein sapB [Raoultella ornithinolytica]
MIIFTLRRLLLLLVTLFFLTFVGFSLSYFTPHAPLQGASLWNAWQFWFSGLLHWDFGVSSINGQLISEQLKEVFLPPWSCVSSRLASRCWWVSPSVCWRGLCATSGPIR